jgi:hypothetical protein
MKKEDIARRLRDIADRLAIGPIEDDEMRDLTRPLRGPEFVAARRSLTAPLAKELSIHIGATRLSRSLGVRDADRYCNPEAARVFRELAEQIAPSAPWNPDDVLTGEQVLEHLEFMPLRAGYKDEEAFSRAKEGRLRDLRNRGLEGFKRGGEYVYLWGDVQGAMRAEFRTETKKEERARKVSRDVTNAAKRHGPSKKFDSPGMTAVAEGGES